MSGIWNSLEIVKLVVSSLTPIVVLVFGIWINRLAKKVEQVQWTNRTIVEWRIKVYDEVAALLNDLLCYYTFVGNWKELSPSDVVETKRALDKKVHTCAPLFSSRFLDLYFDFARACFETYTGWGRDARLRTPVLRHRQAAGEEWLPEWDALFSEDEFCAPPEDVRRAYQDLMRNFAGELGLGLTERAVPAGLVPGNV